VTALAKHSRFLALLGGGLLLRVLLAFVLFPKQGFSTDMQLFASWAATLARVGPGSFYATATGADYPPGYLYVLWLLGNAPASALPLLLKVPAILADLGVALVIYWAARRWLNERAALIAAALYLFIPVTWYDSALWGQVDAVGALLLIASLVLLIERRSEAAIALAVLAILVKPQEAIGLVVVLPVLVRRHLILSGSRRRLLTSAAAGAAALALPLVPFDIGGVAGLLRLFQSDTDRYSVLTANAFNLWALVGSTPLAQIFGGSGGSWTADSLIVVGGMTAVTLGALVLVAIGLVVAGGLLIRDGRVPILLGFAVVAFAFYAVPTRVHERYLFPFFTAGALLAAEFVGASAGYLVVGTLNAINLHAVLAAPLSIGSGVGGFGRGAGPGLGRGGGGFGGLGTQISAIRLPFAELARSETVIALVALGQTAALAALLVAWCVVVIRPRPIARVAEAPYVAWRPSSTS
jgi:dolichyl-phosphate-mannose-protein mannosyltransferase